MSTAFATNIIFQEYDPQVHAGFTPVGTDVVIGGPAFLIHRDSIAQYGILFMNDDYKPVLQIAFTGKIIITGAVIFHDTNNPILYADYYGLFFKNSDSQIVACVDSSGNLHVNKPVIQKQTIALESPGSLTYQSDAVIQYASTNKYILHGIDSTYPIFQVVNASGACLLKVNQDGLIETTSIVVSSGTGGTNQDIVFGSYKF